jgi:hypothetical protein
MDKIGREPTMTQAAYYYATIIYLNAVKAAGTTAAILKVGTFSTFTGCLRLL